MTVVDSPLSSIVTTNGAHTPVALLERLWARHLQTRNWTEAAHIAAHPGLRGPLRTEVANHPNTAVRCAYINRADVDAAAALDVCTGETRLAVMATLTEQNIDDRLQPRLIATLVSAWNAKPGKGIATLIIEQAGEQIATVDAAHAWPILRDALAGAGPNAPARWGYWLARLPGTDISAALADPGVAAAAEAYYDPGAMWAPLLAGEGRDSDTVAVDTHAWCERYVNTYIFYGQRRRLLLSDTLASLPGQVGPTRNALAVANILSCWLPHEQTKSQAVITALTSATIVTLRGGFGPEEDTGTDTAVAADVGTQWAALETLKATYPATFDLTHLPAHPLIIHTNYRRAGWAYDLGPLLEADDDSLAGAAWTFAAQRLDTGYSYARLAAARARFADTPDILTCLDVCAGAADVYVGLNGDDKLGATIDILTHSTQLNDPHVSYNTGDLLNGALQWALDEHLFDLVPWHIGIEMLTIGDRSNTASWHVNLFDVTTTQTQNYADWLAATIEVGRDPEQLWTVIDKVHHGFVGNTGELLASVADIAGTSTAITRTVRPHADIQVVIVDATQA